MVVVMMELPHQVFGYDQVSLLVVNDCPSQCTGEKLKKITIYIYFNSMVFYCVKMNLHSSNYEKFGLDFV